MMTSEFNNFLCRFENRPKPVLCHEFGVGSRCTRCNCPGLDLHYWRKICKVCHCRLDEHDVLLPDHQDHGMVVTRKLFGDRSSTTTEKSESIKQQHIVEEKMISLMDGLKLSDWNCITTTDNFDGQTTGNVQKKSEEREVNGTGMVDGGIHLIDQQHSPINFGRTSAATELLKSMPSTQRQQQFNFKTSNGSVINGNMQKMKKENGRGDNRADWAWAPAGDWQLARRYLMSLDERDRPLNGTDGALARRQRLAQQLPYHDSDVDASKANCAPHEQQLHREFIDMVKKQVVGIAEVVDYAQNKAQIVGILPAQMQQNAVEGRQLLSRCCQQCSAEFAPADVCVVTDHERNKPEAIWHPRCFTCCVCHQFLVDLLYFFHDGKYFCGRHFGEKLYPRCAGCDELIFAREYTFAEEKSWHLEHFCCFGCDRHLSGQRYVVKAEQPYCMDCYMQKFARICISCDDKIAPFDQRITYGELHWHANPNCFRCKCCSTPLSNQKFLLKLDQPFCSPECKVRFLES